MRTYINFIFKLTLGLASYQCFSDVLRVESFVSNSTAAYPEVNVIVFNNGAIAQNAAIYFDFSSPSQRGDCGFSDKAQRSLRFADAYEERTTTALIPAGRWTHRAFAIGAYATEYPCVVCYSIETDSSDHNAQITGSILVTFPDALMVYPNESSKTDFDYVIDHVVERVPDYGAILVRIILRSNSLDTRELYVSDKQITDCGASLDYRNPYIQGLDGGRLVVEKALPAVAIIPIIDDPRITASCKLLVTFSTRGDRTQATDRGSVSKIVSIPLIPTGAYLTLKESRHPLPRIDRHETQ